MTPTLLGRWQTRLLLFTTVGIFISLPFSYYLADSGDNWTVPFIAVGYILIFGFGWDTLYNLLQKLRWDRDWPGIFQLLAGIWEALFIITIANSIDLPGLENFAWQLFVTHYSCVWLGIYIASQSIMRILFPRWRFFGGQWL